MRFLFGAGKQNSGKGAFVHAANQEGANESFGKSEITTNPGAKGLGKYRIHLQAKHINSERKGNLRRHA